MVLGLVHRIQTNLVRIGLEKGMTGSVNETDSLRCMQEPIEIAYDHRTGFSQYVFRRVGMGVVELLIWMAYM